LFPVGSCQWVLPVNSCMVMPLESESP
jgi:hypothetical protein